MDHPVVRYAILVGSVVLVQYALAPQFRIAGVSVDLLLALAIAAGIHSGVERGAIVGFVCGFALDLMVSTPFGLGSVSYLAAGVVAALLEAATVHSARWLTITVGLLASAAGIVCFALVGEVLGQSGMFGGHMVKVLLVVAPTSALLALPLLRACRWADPEEHRLRAAVR